MTENKKIYVLYEFERDGFPLIKQAFNSKSSAMKAQKKLQEELDKSEYQYYPGHYQAYWEEVEVI